MSGETGSLPVEAAKTAIVAAVKPAIAPAVATGNPETTSGTVNVEAQRQKGWRTDLAATLYRSWMDSAQLPESERETVFNKQAGAAIQSTKESLAEGKTPPEQKDPLFSADWETLPPEQQRLVASLRLMLGAGVNQALVKGEIDVHSMDKLLARAAAGESPVSGAATWADNILATGGITHPAVRGVTGNYSRSTPDNQETHARLTTLADQLTQLQMSGAVPWGDPQVDRVMTEIQATRTRDNARLTANDRGATPPLTRDALWTPEQRRHYASLEIYDNATPEQQKELFRTWMLDARREVQDAIDRRSGLGLLFQQPGKQTYLISEIMEQSSLTAGSPDCLTKDPRLIQEQKAVWIPFMAAIEIDVPDAVAASKAVSAVKGREHINFLFRDVTLNAHRRDITVANAMETLDTVVRRRSRDWQAAGNPVGPEFDHILPDAITEFKGIVGDTPDAEYLMKAAADLYEIGGRQTMYKVKKPLFWMGRVTRFDYEMLGHKGASDYVKSQQSRIPAFISDYWSYSIFEPNRRLETTPVTAAELAGINPLNPAGVSARDLARGNFSYAYNDPTYLLTADRLKAKDFGGSTTNMEVYFNDQMKKAYTIVEGQGYELIQQWAADPLQGIALIQKAANNNAFLQELNDAQRSRFIRSLMEITIEYNRKPAIPKGPDGKVFGVTISSNPMDYDKSLAWHEAKAAGIKHPSNTSFDREENAAKFVSAHATLLSEADKEILRTRYYPHERASIALNKSKDVAAGLGKVAAETVAKGVGGLFKG